MGVGSFRRGTGCVQLGGLYLDPEGSFALVRPDRESRPLGHQRAAKDDRCLVQTCLSQIQLSYSPPSGVLIIVRKYRPFGGRSSGIITTKIDLKWLLKVNPLQRNRLMAIKFRSISATSISVSF